LVQISDVKQILRIEFKDYNFVMDEKKVWYIRSVLPSLQKLSVSKEPHIWWSVSYPRNQKKKMNLIL